MWYKRNKTLQSCCYRIIINLTLEVIIFIKYYNVGYFIHASMHAKLVC